MLDFIKCSFECEHEYIGKDYIAKSPLDSILNDTPKIYGFVTGKDIKGVLGSNIKVRTLGDHNRNILEVSGNIAKFLQGHNLFGSNDINHYVVKTIKMLSEDKKLKIHPTDEQLLQVKKGNFHITRLDINQNYHLQSSLDVDRWIKVASDKMTMSSYGQVKNNNHTLYFGGNSKPKKIIFYGKAKEIKANQSLPQQLQTPEMLDYANKLLRFEIRLNAHYLNNNYLSEGYCWNTGKVNEIIDTHLSRIRIAANIRLADSKLNEIPDAYLSTYFKWKAGVDVKQNLNQSKFYRHRNHLLKYGVDISTVMPKLEQPTMDLMDVFKNEANIPDWAYEKSLVA